ARYMFASHEDNVGSVGQVLGLIEYHVNIVGNASEVMSFRPALQQESEPKLSILMFDRCAWAHNHLSVYQFYLELVGRARQVSLQAHPVWDLDVAYAGHGCFLRPESGQTRARPPTPCYSRGRLPCQSVARWYMCPMRSNFSSSKAGARI